MKKKSGSDKENQTTKTSESSQVTDIMDMSATTFTERLEANNKRVQNGITPSVKSEIKYVNMEVLKKVEDIFTIFKRHANILTLIHLSKHHSKIHEHKSLA